MTRYQSTATFGILAKMGNLQLSPGSLFANRFEIDKTAGSGGMGTVYRAIDRYSGDTVALKLLHPGAGRADEADRFIREAQLLSELRHPGIVAHVAHGQIPDGQRFLAMEWLDGQDLGQRLFRGPLPLRDCLVLLEHVAAALSVAHQRGIVHRDLKPSNLFLCGSDVAQVKILDFGIARRLATSQAMTRTGMVIGTPEYMAPEQARGSRDLTPAADLFSLGCVLYECLTGQPPFVADHIAAVLVQVLFEEPISIEERRPGISAAISALVGRLLAKDPSQRPADATALRAELLSLGDVTESELAITLAGPKARAQSFAEQEQSLFSVVLAAPSEEDLGLGATLPSSAPLLAPEDRQALLQAVADLGVSPDFLANDSLIVTVPTMGSAQDQATRAARAALLIKDRWPTAVISMATGRGAIHGRTAVGEVVDMAARSLRSGSQPSQAAPPTQVLIDSLSAKLLEGRFALTPQPEGAILLYEERDTDKSRPLLGKPTPCVGREAELHNLEGQLSSCIEESEARVALVTAPPGGGKSRLRHEFLRRTQQRNTQVTVLLGRGDIMSAGTPYGILGDAIRRLCGIHGGESVDIKQQLLRTRISLHLAASKQSWIPLFIGELAGVQFSTDEHPLLRSARQDPPIMRDHLHRALLDWLAAEIAYAPLLLLLDDLQWGDELSVAALDDALSIQCASPLLLLAFARPEVHQQFPNLWQVHKVQEIGLKGLSKKACERLIEQVLGKSMPAALVARIVEQSAGNALFLEELIRSIDEGHADEQPATVLAMLQARIGRLEHGARRTIRAASIFGESFWSRGVLAVLGAETQAGDLERWLRVLADSEFIEQRRDSRLAGDKEWRFRHSLVRDAAYGLLSAEDVCRAHHAAILYLEEAGEKDERILAEHSIRAADSQRAAKYLIQAAERLMEQSYLEATQKTVERGLPYCTDPRSRAALLRFRALAYHFGGDMERTVSVGLEVLPHLPVGSSDWCFLAGCMINAAAMIDRPDVMMPLLQAVLAVDPVAFGSKSYADMAIIIGMMFAWSGSRDMFQMIMARARQSLGADWAKEPRSRANYHLAEGFVISAIDPTPWRAVDCAEQALADAQEAGHARMGVFAQIALAIAKSGVGLYEEAERLLDLVDADWPFHREPLATLTSLYNRLILLWQRDEPSNAEPMTKLAEKLLKLADNKAIYTGLAHIGKAHAEFWRGHVEAGIVEAKTAVEQLAMIPVYRISAFEILCRLLLLAKQQTEAETVAQQAQMLIQSLGGGGNFELPLRLRIVESLFAAGKEQEGREELREAIAELERRVQQAPDEQARATYLQNVPAHRCILELAKVQFA